MAQRSGYRVVEGRIGPGGVEGVPVTLQPHDLTDPPRSPVTETVDARARLRADCGRCAGLCRRPRVGAARGEAATARPAGFEHPPHRGAR